MHYHVLLICTLAITAQRIVHHSTMHLQIQQPGFDCFVATTLILDPGLQFTPNNITTWALAQSSSNDKIGIHTLFGVFEKY